MPATKLSHSFRNFINRTFKKNGVKKAQPPQIIVASNEVELQRSPMIRPVDIPGEYDICDAFHDPGVLDVRQNVRYGLNSNTTIEVDGLAFSIVAAAPSPLLSPPSPEFSGVIEGSVSDQGTPSLTFDTSSSHASRSLSSLPIPNASTTNGEARELSLSDLHIVRLLSQGSSGQVYHVIDKLTCERRALKVIPHLGKLAYEILSILTEQTLMRALNYKDSPYYLRLQASFCDSKNFYLVMPLYTTDLESEILRLGKLDVDRARFYFVEAAPFNPRSDDFYDMRREILQTEVTFRPEDGVDDITKDFILQLLQKSPADRLQSTALENHPFLAGVNWSLFEKKQVPAPWIPGPYPTHICPSQPREFTPGVAITGTNPYTAFEYASDEVAAGVVNACDVVKGEELPEGFQYLPGSAVSASSRSRSVLVAASHLLPAS
ncbi:hypothetical protein H0H93_001503 [Arthromyces matolae]|nr:hypothetical protein H0H93_001503 [Arthromyces matolae]